jgi:hypothetical protein
LVELAVPRSFREILAVYRLQLLLVSASMLTLATVFARDMALGWFGAWGIAVLLAIYVARRALRRFLFAPFADRLRHAHQGHGPRYRSHPTRPTC